MGLISTTTKRLAVPDDPQAWIDIRMVSWLTLDKAKTEKLKAIFAMRDLILSAASMNNGQLAEARAAAAADPAAEYDQLTILRHGVVAWSYDGEVDVERFDEATAEWAARAIVAYTKPSEAETKTPSSLSTGT